ncbi:MAG: hypothetical protein N3C63_05395 [Rhodocyclaceae bacterium]|nr:hypothetical protein [Rhodocyclaceae bacterium]
MHQRTTLALLLLFQLPAAWAQAPIERVKITDGELTCRQIHDEHLAMDKIIAEAKAIQAEGEKTALAGQAGGVAAEVASRTGLFGQIGGLFGHIAGSVAAKTAADVAGQSGMKTAAQAKEREAQALARKEHLTALFVAKGCKASDPDAPAANPQAIVPLPAQSQAPALPLEEVLRQAVADATPLGVELKLDRSGSGIAKPRVFVPNFRVAFVVKTVAHAYAGGGLANIGSRTPSPIGVTTITQAQNKRVEMALAGADAKFLQALTDRLYEDFLARLKAAGREVVPFEEVVKTPGYTKIKFVEQKPYTVNPTSQGDRRGYMVFTPSNMPLFFVSSSIDTYLSDRLVDLDTQRAVYELAARLDAVALMPTVQIDIAEIESSGRSRWRSDAHADLIPKLGLVARSSLFYTDGYDAKIFYDGRFGSVKLDKGFYLDGEFGSVKTVDAYDTASLANALTLATGAQGVQYFNEKRELKIDPLKFAQGVMKVGATFNENLVAALRP